MPYRVDEINKKLRKENYSFRVIKPLGPVIGEGSQFVAMVTACEIGAFYIDSNLERYLLRYGRFYLCTNFDLLGMKEAERQGMLLELSGLLIY